MIPGQCPDLSPPRRARPVTAGCGARGKAQGPPPRPGATGKGKAGCGATKRESSMMPRQRYSPCRGAVRGDRSDAAEMRQAAAVQHSRPCGYRCSRGIEDALPQPFLSRAEHGNHRQVRCVSAGRPTVREAESRGGNRMPKKRMPAAERRRETRAEGRAPAAALHNRPDTGPGARLRKQADVRQVSL